MNDMTPSEPTMADVLAAINGVAADVGQLRTEMGVRFDHADAKLEQVRADIAQVRADVAATKAEALFSEARATDAQEAIRRHLADPHAHGRDAA